MEFEVTPIEFYEVSIDGQKIGRFEKESEWEGFIKLVSPKGQIIAYKGHESPFEHLFKGIFENLGDKGSGSGMQLVAMTPTLMPSTKSKDVELDGWEKWDGGKGPPCKGNVLVDVVLRDGSQLHSLEAGVLDWSRDISPLHEDILKYRILDEQHGNEVGTL